MEYKGFDIIKRAGLFMVICTGFILGSATTLNGAKELIENFIYNEG
jgi:hypothetical protein